MRIRRLVAGGLATASWLLATTAQGALQPLDTSDPQNGVLGIYSATFDGPRTPCQPTSPPYCAFFGGDPAAVRNIVIVPTPSKVINGVPGGITPVPAPGSSLDVTVNAAHTQVTLAGGTVALPTLALVIDQGTASETNIVASGAGMVFSSTPVTVPIDANRVATIQLDVAPSLAVDFSALSVIVTNANCTGPLCSLVQILTLDMVRYYFTLTFDPTFTTFKGTYIGQTPNGSMVFATLNAAPPAVTAITVTDSVAPTNDRQVPFGNVTVGNTATRTVTIASSGTSPLILGTLGSTDTLAPPFSLANDTCSGQTLAPNTSCTVDVVFAPTTVGNPTDTFDIPSNDPNQSTVIVSLTGTGTPLPVPNIAVYDSVAPTSDLLIPYGSVTQGQQADETVTVQNRGTADLTLGTVASSTPLAAPFSIVYDACSGLVLTAESTCTIGVRFAPVALGDFTDDFDIPSDDPDEPVVTFKLTGTGVAPPVPRIKSDLDLRFGDVAAGATADLTVTVGNLGAAPLLLGVVGATDPLASPYSFVTDNCSAQTLAPTETCTIVVRFAPTDRLVYNDSFDIPSNDPDSSITTVETHGGPAAPGPRPDGASAGPFGAALDGGTLLALLAAVPAARRARRRVH